MCKEQKDIGYILIKQRRNSTCTRINWPSAINETFAINNKDIVVLDVHYENTKVSQMDAR